MTPLTPIRPYEDAAYPPGPWPPSFWCASVGKAVECAPLSSDLEVDVLIVGAGYTGLNAALELRENSGQSVALIDAGNPAWGASGRNGGFCCLGGSALSVAGQIKRFGLEETRRYLGLQHRAIDQVARFLDESGQAADRHSDGELLLAHKASVYKDMLDNANVIKNLGGIDFQAITKKELAAHGVNGPGFHGGVITKAGFALNPMKYAQSLLAAVQKAGVQVFGNTEMQGIWSEPIGVRVAAGAYQIRAKKLILATNGYANDSVPKTLGGRQLPVISAIMVTRPLSEEELAAQGWTSDLMAYDSRHLLHYFRKLPDGRFLIGQRGALFVNPVAEERARKKVRRDFEVMFPAWRHVETDYFWSGFVSLTRDLTQYIGPVPGLENCFTAFGYHGNGVAMASLSGRLVAQLSQGEVVDLPPQMTRLPRRFPLGRHRRLLLQAAFAKYWLQDRLGH